MKNDQTKKIAPTPPIDRGVGKDGYPDPGTPTDEWARHLERQRQDRLTSEELARELIPAPKKGG